MGDKELFDALHNGDPEAFETLFRKYFKVLTVFADRILCDLDQAEDVVQDVFVKFFESKEKLKVHTSIKALLYQSVRNKCLDHLRSINMKMHHHEEILINAKGEELIHSDLLLQTELEEKIYRAISQLPDQCQKIFTMNRLEGKRNQEIADELNISKRTVETQISNALKKLRTEIFQYLKTLIFIVLYFFS